jgi:hypothetical protein
LDLLRFARVSLTEREREGLLELVVIKPIKAKQLEGIEIAGD